MTWCVGSACERSVRGRAVAKEQWALCPDPPAFYLLGTAMAAVLEGVLLCG